MNNDARGANMHTPFMQTPFFEFYCAGLKNAADMMTASLESARRLQQQQLEALQSAIEEQSRSMRELTEVHTVEQLIALQSKLAGSQLERAVGFWSRVWSAAGDNQLALMAQAQLGQVREAQSAVQEQRAA
jgi:Phasin protein